MTTSDLYRENGENAKNMNRLDRVMGSLLETWGQRYEFVHDREDSKITFQVPGFTLTAVEQKKGDGIELLYEEAGTKHKVACSTDDAPRMIEALLFPEPEVGRDVPDEKNIRPGLPGSKNYFRSLRISGLSQIFLLLLTGFVADGGVAGMWTLYAVGTFWVGALLVMIRRRNNPSELDLFFVGYGFVVIAFIYILFGAHIYEFVQTSVLGN